MNKSEVAEIKKQLNHENCSITKVSGCYVNGEKAILARFTNTFLNMPEDETFKYFEIFKKTLSGTIGKNLINLDFPSTTEFDGSPQEALLKLKKSELKNEALLDEFYKKIVDLYDCTDSYFITVIYAAYDVPCKTKDKQTLEDASEEVYSYILCSISPVTLSKPGLCFNEDAKNIEKQTRNWVVNAPSTGFLYPAFNNRSTDVNSVLYYSKDSEKLQKDFVYGLLGCDVPMTAGGQKEMFQRVIKETLGADCDYGVVKTIHNKLNEVMEKQKMRQVQEPLVLSKAQVKELFYESGVPDDKLSEFDTKFEEIAGENISLLAANVASPKVFEVKASDVVLKVPSERSDLVETKMVDGRRCLVIAIAEEVEVNGLQVKSLADTEKSLDATE